MSTAMNTSRGPRARNRRGEGAQLRDDIVSAAGTILERTGRDDAITLRAIARTIGITAPSIYLHFDDREQILRALIVSTFDRLTDALRPATVDPDPVVRLHAIGHAYLAFATEHASLYRVLFERHHDAAGVLRPEAPNDVTTMVGAEAFGILLHAVDDCRESGKSTAVSAEAAATAWWVGLHGLATLRASMPYFPWPPLTPQLDDLTDRLADIAPGRVRRNSVAASRRERA
ncbi:TetR/AcrR family transcriptional regulator [Jatrophihabitans sp. YIM 134969]